MQFIRHIVLLKLNRDIDEKTKADLASDLAEMKSLCPGLINIHLGDAFDMVGLMQGYNWGFSMDFASKEALKNYDQHPQHQAFVKKVEPLLVSSMAESVLVFDYQVEEVV